MSKSAGPAIDYRSLRLQVVSSGEFPRELVERALATHLDGGGDPGSADGFLAVLRRIAASCDDAEFEAFITRGEQPVVPLTPRQMEAIKGGASGCEPTEGGFAPGRLGPLGGIER